MGQSSWNRLLHSQNKILPFWKSALHVGKTKQSLSNMVCRNWWLKPWSDINISQGSHGFRYLISFKWKLKFRNCIGRLLTTTIFAMAPPPSRQKLSKKEIEVLTLRWWIKEVGIEITHQTPMKLLIKTTACTVLLE